VKLNIFFEATWLQQIEKNLKKVCRIFWHFTFWKRYYRWK